MTGIWLLWLKVRYGGINTFLPGNIDFQGYNKFIILEQQLFTRIITLTIIGKNNSNAGNYCIEPGGKGIKYCIIVLTYVISYYKLL